MLPLTITSRQRLAILAAACLLSLAMPASSAWAQKVKNKTPAPAATTSQTELNVDIPTIEAVGANVDEATLRDIFSGNLVDNAQALAGLDATSITIPEITFSASATVDGEANGATITFSDLVLTDIVDGTAGSVSLSAMSMDAGDEGSAEFGTLSASSLNIGGMLGMYGLVDAGGQTAMQTIYSDFSFEGGSFEAPGASCTMGAMSVAEFKARPLKTSFAEMITLAETLESQGDDASPELIGKALRMYVDVFTAFESSPASFGGFDCAGTDDEGREVNFSIAGMSVGGLSSGVYPAITVEGLDVTVEGDGTVQVGSITIKEMDLSAPIAAILGAPAAIDEAWFTANARALIPAFAGFAIGDVVVDVPDPEEDGERIQASIGAFDLSLGAYLNGIPTDLLTSASNIYVELPQDTDDEQMRQLIDLGLTSIEAGFTINAAWNASDNTIAIDEISLTGADLATVKLAGTITNATDLLFGLDEDSALAAAMGLALSQLKLDIADAGLSEIILASVAAEQGTTPATMRPIFAGLAEGTVVGLLAGAAEAQKVGAALNAFVSGKAKSLTIDMKVKSAPGLSLVDFMAAESDPTSLIGKVVINASAK